MIACSFRDVHHSIDVAIPGESRVTLQHEGMFPAIQDPLTPLSSNGTTIRYLYERFDLPFPQFLCQAASSSPSAALGQPSSPSIVFMVTASTVQLVSLFVEDRSKRVGHHEFFLDLSGFVFIKDVIICSFLPETRELPHVDVSNAWKRPLNTAQAFAYTSDVYRIVAFSRTSRIQSCFVSLSTAMPRADPAERRSQARRHPCTWRMGMVRSPWRRTHAKILGIAAVPLLPSTARR